MYPTHPRGYAVIASVERISEPVVTPIGLDEVKAQLRITDDDDDLYLTALLGAAVSYLDGHGALGRSMISQGWAQRMQYPNGRVPLRMSPVTALTAVKYFDTDNAPQTATLADYRLFAGKEWAYVEPIVGSAWPTAFDSPDAVTLEFTAGFGSTPDDVPADLRHALLLLISHWYQNREASTEATVKEIPMGFDMLLSAHRVSWYG